MKKNTILLSLLVLIVLIMAVSVSVSYAKYSSTLTDNSLTISIDGRTYEKRNITHNDTAAYEYKDGILTINKYFFQDDRWYVTTGIAADGFSTLNGFRNGLVVKMISYPDTVTTIGANAFYGWGSLTSLPILANVTQFSPSEGMRSLIAYTVETGNKNYSADDDGVLYNIDGKYLIRYPQGRPETNNIYRIGEIVENIDPSAFSDNTSLTAILVNSVGMSTKVDVTGGNWGATNAIAIQNDLSVEINEVTLENGIYTVALKDATLNGYEITQTGKGGTQHDNVKSNTFTLDAEAYGSSRWLIFDETPLLGSYAYVLLDSEGTLHMYAGMSAESLPNIGDPLPPVNEAAMISDATVVARFKMPTHIPGATHWGDDVEFSDWDVAKTAIAVKVETEINATTTTNWFADFEECESFDLRLLDTSRVTDMSGMFLECQKVKKLDLSTFNTALVTDMNNMFGWCYALSEINLSSFNTSRVSNMTKMFNTCQALETLDLSSFSNASLTGIGGMFDGASKLKTIYVGNQWVSKDYDAGNPFGNNPYLTGGRGTVYKDGQAGTSYACVDNDMGVDGYFTYRGELLIHSAIDGVSITAELNDEGNVLLTFTGDPIPEAVKIISTKPGIANESYILYETDDGRNCTTISTVFYEDNQIISVCKEDPVVFAVLKEDNTLEVRTGFVSLKSDGTAEYIDENDTLITCSQERIYSSPTEVNGYAKGSGSPWNTATAATKVVFIDSVKPTEATTSWFNGLSNCETIDLRNVDFSAVKKMDYMFKDCSSLTTIIWPTENNTASLTNMSNMFYGCAALTAYPLPENFSTTAVTSMENLFYGCSSIQNLELPDSFNTSAVRDMQRMFYGCTALETIQWSPNFNTQSATLMYSMFEKCAALETLSLPATFTMQNVTSLNNMFAECGKLKMVNFPEDISTANITNMSAMFRSCVALTDNAVLDILRQFDDTSNVTNIAAMFNGCTGLRNFVWPTNFNTASVSGTDNGGGMIELFQNCTNLETVDLTNMSTTSLLCTQQFFYGCTSLTTVWVGADWSMDKVTKDSRMFYNCVKLVGGNGTTFKTASVVDRTYARIDGENGLPGYFTAKDPNAVTYANVTVQVAEDAPFSWTPAKGNFGNENQHHFFTGMDNIIILKNTDGTRYSGNVVINSGEPVEVTDGKLTLSADLVTEGATITLSAAAETQLLEDGGLVHLTATCDPAEMIPGEAFAITLTPDAGYVLPDTVTVAIDGEDKTDKVTYANGVITIPAGLVTEGITISVTAEGKQQISVTTVFTSELTVSCSPTVPVPGQAFVVTLTGETLPDGVTVTIDGTEATTAAYDKTAGTITIPGNLLTSETTSIAITEAAAEVPTPICNCTEKCEEGTTNNDCPVCSTTPENCSPVICTCETLCAEDAGNAECPVCSTDAANCSPKEPETAAECVCTVTCTEDTVNADCEVCTADWSKCGIQADPAPTEATPTITVNTNGISGLTFSPDAAPAINQNYTAGIAPVEGYTLPETITVTIGADRYTVNLSGENEDGKPDFEGGKLIIPGTLLTEETTITIEAAGVAVPADENNSGEDNSDEDNPPPADDSTQPTGVEETQPPADDDNSSEETQPSADENTQPPVGEDTQPPADDNTQPPADGNDNVPEQPEQPEATEGGSTGVDPPTE